MNAIYPQTHYQGAQKILMLPLLQRQKWGFLNAFRLLIKGDICAFARGWGLSMSLETSLRKAQTAACYGVPSGDIEGIDIKLVIGTDGKRINLRVVSLIVEGNLLVGLE